MSLLQDDLIERLGGPDKVAELTGRRKRMVRDPDTGRYQYKMRAQDCPVDQARLPDSSHSRSPFQHACRMTLFMKRISWIC